MHHRFQSKNVGGKILINFKDYFDLKYLQPTVAELHQYPPSHQASVGYQAYPEVEWTESHWHTVCCHQMAASPASVEAATVAALVLLHLHINQAGILLGSQILLSMSMK
jgi:hypothetical protein